MAHDSTAREALRRIADIAAAVMEDEEYRPGNEGGESSVEHEDAEISDVSEAICTPKALPKRLLKQAADVAVQMNPVNAPLVAHGAGFGLSAPSDPLFISVLTSKYWGAQSRRLTVSFTETTAANLRTRILSHLNAWTKTSGISFVETQRDGQIRISRSGSGYWSYLGTDVLLIPRNRPTMNLQAFTMNTPESEYKRVIRHEAGHTLGFPHEHMRKALVDRIDPQKAYDFFQRTQGWDRQTVDQQVLTSLSEQSLMSTPPDETSIMCYQLPGSITRDGRPILGGLDINSTDFGFAGRIYPKQGSQIPVGRKQALARVTDDWPEAEDVHVDLANLYADV